MGPAKNNRDAITGSIEKNKNLETIRGATDIIAEKPADMPVDMSEKNINAS